MKKLLLTTVFSLLIAISAIAQDSGTTGNLTWNFDSGTGILTISGEGAMPNYNWEDSYSPWNSYRFSITHVNITDGVTSIGESAFWGCTSLESISLPESVTSIGYEAFYYCTSLTSIIFPEGLTSIGEWAFSSCRALVSVTLPQGLTSIEGGAFSICTNLTPNANIM